LLPFSRTTNETLVANAGAAVRSNTASRTASKNGLTWRRSKAFSAVRFISVPHQIARACMGRCVPSMFHIRADTMGSFRNRLLVLIIGLVIVTQSVTLIAVLARVEQTVAGRASDELGSGGAFIEQMIRFRASQLASGVGVLAADFGFREAMASGDPGTQLSAANNHLRRIGADLMLLLDNRGALITSTQPVCTRERSSAKQAASLPQKEVITPSR
jgi:hypothetical protein